MITTTEIDKGGVITYRGRTSGKLITARVNRVYEVSLDGEVIGYVRYTMLTRETRSRGKRYVNSRWSSPGWCWSTTRLGRYFESFPSTKSASIDILVRHSMRHA